MKSPISQEDLPDHLSLHLFIWYVISTAVSPSLCYYTLLCVYLSYGVIALQRLSSVPFSFAIPKSI